MSETFSEQFLNTSQCCLCLSREIQIGHFTVGGFACQALSEPEAEVDLVLIQT